MKFKIFLIWVLAITFVLSIVNAETVSTDTGFVRNGGDSGTGNLLGFEFIPKEDRKLEWVDIDSLVSATGIRVWNGSGTLTQMGTTHAISGTNNSLSSQDIIFRAGHKYVITVGNGGATYTRSYDTLWSPVSDSYFNVTQGVCVSDTLGNLCGYSTTGYNIEYIGTSVYNPDVEDSLTNYYEFTNDLTDSIGSDDLSNTGTSFTTDKNSVSNQAVATGSSAYMNVNSQLMSGNSQTISMWVYPTDVSSYNVIYRQMPSGSDRSFLFDWDSSVFNIAFSSTSATSFDVTYASGSGVLVNNQWQHIVVTRENTNVKLYIDGVESPLIVLGGTPFSGNIRTMTSPQSKFSESSGGFQGKMDEIRFYDRYVYPEEVMELYNCYDNCPIVSTEPNNITIITPTNGTIYPYTASIVPFHATTTNNASCQVNLTNMSTTDNKTHYYNYTLPAPTTSVQEFNFNVSCLDTELNVSDYELVTVFLDQLPQNTILVDEPMMDFNYTYDVTSLDINISTNYPSTCYVNGNVLSNTGLLEHTDVYTLPNATNVTQTIVLAFNCVDTVYSDNVTTNVTVYKQQVPLDFNIYVPIDQQLFDYDTNEIMYQIETNYQAQCTHLTYNMTAPQVMNNVSNTVHTYPYSSFYPNNDEYPVSFVCTGLILNETVVKNVTYYIDEAPVQQSNEVIATGLLVGDFTRDVLEGTGDGLLAIAPAIVFVMIGLALAGGVTLVLRRVTGVKLRG